MNRLFIVALLFTIMMSGCWRCNNTCHEMCYMSIALSAEPIDESVKVYEYADDLERVGKEQFSDCIVRGKSYFSSPYIGVEKLKRFAAKIGANVVLCQRKLERAGLDFECQCNVPEIIESRDNPADDPNMVRVVSASASVSGSTASGRGQRTSTPIRYGFCTINTRIKRKKRIRATKRMVILQIKLSPN